MHFVRKKNHKRNLIGFTLMELLVVMMLITLASVMAVPALQSFYQERLVKTHRQWFENQLSHLRAQAILTQQRHWLCWVDQNGAYLRLADLQNAAPVAIQSCTGPDNACTLIARRTLARQLTYNFNGSAVADDKIIFNAIGRLNPNGTLTLSAGRASEKIILRQSGYMNQRF